jgi:hypothetical protein
MHSSGWGPIAGLWFLAGAGIEVFNGWTRRWTAERLMPQQRARSVGWLAGGFFLRVVLTAGVLVLAFRHSFVSGLLAWLGYYVCRTVLTWRMARHLERSSERRTGQVKSS